MGQLAKHGCSLLDGNQVTNDCLNICKVDSVHYAWVYTERVKTVSGVGTTKHIVIVYLCHSLGCRHKQHASSRARRKMCGGRRKILGLSSFVQLSVYIIHTARFGIHFSAINLQR